jgi:hypothetical protein
MPKWVKYALLFIVGYLVLTAPHEVANFVQSAIHSLSVLGNSLKSGG